MMPRLYHLVAAADWPDGNDDYRPPSLETEGFIHLSTSSQVAATSLRYFADVADLLLVEIDPDALGAEVRWEDLIGHGDFPHLFGALNRSAVVSATLYTPGTAVAG